MFFVGPNHNPVFQLCTHANRSAAQFLVSEFNENGDLITHNIETTQGYTRNLLQDGTVALILGHNKGKWSDKFSAVEIIVDHVYILPTPLRPENTLSESTTITTTTNSASSTPTTTPVKKARLTSINLD